jgi:murein DD-endopeptidase MepM/ murein hydrolase activator NlpD
MLRFLSLAFALSVLSGCAPDAPVSTAPGRDITLVADSALVHGEVDERDTLDSVLRDHGLAEQAVQTTIAAVRSVFDPRRLRAARPFTLERTLEGALRLFEYEIDADSLLRVRPATPGDTALRAELAAIPKAVEPGVVSAAIDRDTPSLFQAMAAAGEGAELTLALAGVFSGEIDFNTEIQAGDRFALAFERFVRAGRPSTYGPITAAEFHNDGRVVRAIRFAQPDGQFGYFDELGRSLRRLFLRSPLKFDPRITSRYSTSRFHPVLQGSRAHRGVDYGAPTGAPVVSVGTGTVVSVTVDATNGRMVRIRHASGYDSFYLHLSAFAAGIRRGARVDQGQTIGLVGSTGLATGPHLHYGLQKNGAWVDPLEEHRRMPPGDPVPSEMMEAFARVRDQALSSLRAASGPASAGQAQLSAAQ